MKYRDIRKIALLYCITSNLLFLDKPALFSDLKYTHGTEAKAENPLVYYTNQVSLRG